MKRIDNVRGIGVGKEREEESRNINMVLKCK